MDDAGLPSGHDSTLPVSRRRVELGENLLRIKGIVNVADENLPRVIHAVQHTIYPAATLSSWPDEDRSTRLVFITRDLDEAMVRETLSSFLTETSTT